MDPTTLPSRTLVTASDRLARRLHEQAADAALAAGKRAWERPDILPVGAFWRRLFVELQQDPALAIAGRRPLSRAAMHCRWEALLAETFADNPLLQTAGAARTALDAWQLCQAWLLDVSALGADPLEETRLLVEWGQRFEQECVARGLLPDYAVPEAVLGALEQSERARALLPREIELAGFMEMTPRDEQRWQSLRALGVSVKTLPAADQQAEVRVVACSDVTAETRDAAAWAQRELLDNPLQRVALVVPDLSSRRVALHHALLETLCPDRVGGFDTDSLPFNFSLGEALGERALVADALALLALAQRPAEFPALARLCRSPYLGVPAERSQRYALESRLRHEGFAEASLADLAWLARREHCAAFADALDALREIANAERDDTTPSRWARRFSHWLTLAGWCGGRALDSNEYQAREAFTDLLGRLGELDVVLGNCPRATALGWLQRFASETPFQPRANDAPVQVIGLLEASGLAFDAIRVVGLTDDVLPAAPRPNPFLPVELQRDKGLPQSSAARELGFAEQLFKGLRQSTPRLVCSYAERDGDAEMGPSPLLGSFTRIGGETPPPSPAQRLAGRVALECIEDSRAPAHRGGHVRGGTALLQDQSHCPFRAFAVHRLDADDWPTPQPGPDALVRGLVTHRVMEKLWTRWRTRDVLAGLNERGEVLPQVRETVAVVLEDSRRRMPHRWNRRLLEVEQRRLENLVMRWIEQVELHRPAFEVIEIEGRTGDGREIATHVKAGGIELSGKLDRVDRLADGRELVIDYKSGEAPGKNDFFGERPRAPQLPAYFLARRQAGSHAVAGVAVASLKAGREKLQGVAQPDIAATIPGLADISKIREIDDWAGATRHWEAAIDSLGSDFVAGHAAVDPLKGACDYCHLSGLCRIHEQQREADDDND